MKPATATVDVVIPVGIPIEIMDRLFSDPSCRLLDKAFS